MKFIDENSTVEDMNKQFDRLYRRIRALELNIDTVLRTSAPSSPTLGDMWHDVEGGKIQVYNGSTWDVWSKD
jgi:hypothetical protein